jgi:hypothetical protein
MPWYATHYDAVMGRAVKEAGRPQGGDYTSFVWARNKYAAGLICHRRGIGESVFGPSGKKALPRPERRLSDMLRKRKLSPRDRIGIIHAAAFLSGIWATANNRPAWDVLGDEGILHTIIHSLANGSPTRARVIDRVRAMEQQIPGYLSGRDT